MNELIRFVCPKCGKKLKAKNSDGSRHGRCSCGTRVDIPASLASSRTSDPIEERLSRRMETLDQPHSNPIRSPLIPFASYGLLANSVLIALTAILFFTSHFAAAAILLLISIVIGLIYLAMLITLVTAKSRAIRSGHKEVDVLFGLAKLVLWEETEGLLVLKDKRITDVIHGTEDGGGVLFIYPIMGEEVRVRVPLTLQMCEFHDHNVLTRESIRIFVKLALWWRIKDRDGLERFYLLVDKESHYLSDARHSSRDQNGILPVVLPAQPIRPHQGASRRRELAAAERWLLTLAESSLRKLIAKSSVASVVSHRSAKYLDVASRHDGAAPGSIMNWSDSENDTNPDHLSQNLFEVLSQETERYGLAIDRLEIQELRLPETIQESVDRVWKASLLPAQTAQEALARSTQIRAELEAVRDIIGVDAAAMDRIMSNLKGASMIGSGPQFLNQLFSEMAKNRTDRSSANDTKQTQSSSVDSGK